MSKRAYEKELEDMAHDNDGDNWGGMGLPSFEFADTLAMDSDIVKYINYHYPEFRGNKNKIRQRIQWDLEMYV